MSAATIPTPQPGDLNVCDVRDPTYDTPLPIYYKHAADDELRELKHSLGCQHLLYSKLKRRFDDQHAQLVIWKKKFKDLGGKKKLDQVKKLADMLSVKESENIALRRALTEFREKTEP